MPTEQAPEEYHDEHDRERKTEYEESTDERTHQANKMAQRNRLSLQLALEEDPLGAIPAELEDRRREHDSQHRTNGTVTRNGRGDDDAREEPHRERYEWHRGLAEERLRCRCNVSDEADPRRRGLGQRRSAHTLSELPLGFADRLVDTAWLMDEVEARTSVTAHPRPAWGCE